MDGGREEWTLRRFVSAARFFPAGSLFFGMNFAAIREESYELRNDGKREELGIHFD